MKGLISLGILIGGGVGGWLGSLADHTGLGLWSVLGTLVGSLLGIWAGYKIGSSD